MICFLFLFPDFGAPLTRVETGQWNHTCSTPRQIDALGVAHRRMISPGIESAYLLLCARKKEVEKRLTEMGSLEPLLFVK
jgi:hypothetical protein